MMRTWATVALGALGLIGLLAADLIMRARSFHVPSAVPVTLAGPIAVDADRVARHLGEAVRFRTIAHENPAEDEPATFVALHEWMASTYPAFHAAAAREVIAGGALLYTWTGSDPALAPIILMAHQDVVPVTPDADQVWQVPPFSGEIRDGAVWGRGTLDDKGSLVALLEALETLAAEGARPRRTIILASGHNEEVSGAGARAIAEVLTRRGIKAEFVLDEGGLVLAGHPITGGPAGQIGIAEKGYATLRITARAVGGHSSTPPADSAVRTLAQAILAITDNPFPLRLEGAARDGLRALAPQAPFALQVALVNDWLFRPLLIREMAKSPLGAALLHTTMAPTMLQGSIKANVLPTSASALINYRLAPGDAPEDVMARARASVGALAVDLAWEGEPRPASRVSATDTPGFGLISALTAEILHAPSGPLVTIGATDAGRMEGVAKDVYRFSPLTLSAAETVMLHGVDEHVRVADLASMVQFYGRLVKTAAF